MEILENYSATRRKLGASWCAGKNVRRIFEEWFREKITMNPKFLLVVISLGSSTWSMESRDERRRETKIGYRKDFLYWRKRLKRKEGSSSVAQDEGGAAHEANKQPWKDSNATTIWRKYVKWKHGGVGKPHHHILHHICSSLSFHGAPSKNARRRDHKHSLSNWSPSPLEQFRGGLAVRVREEPIGPGLL
jgi:hypothetical protein